MNKPSKKQLGTIAEITLMTGIEAKALYKAYNNGDLSVLTAKINKICVEYTASSKPTKSTGSKSTKKKKQ